ncbi:23S rRNA (guanosine2251-2'-O)-methyltransferase [Pseudonocardia eucalypti]|uniref:TrmH family RNA methyltransferase n=1 Tax=Pseudonocardia eucalypti TaxID=648755 RepID=UPI001807139E|nr:23S rRNA (guanosine2251-2'-O)-methyltransferase [Pseudonocardia eucalypti]
MYGRKPVLEALADPALSVDKVIAAEDLSRSALGPILSAARERGVPVRRATAHRVKVLAGNGRHDQGVLADVVAPRMRLVTDFLAALPAQAPCALLVLDAVTNPANVGMVLRSATAAGVDGVLLPRRGVPAIDPLVIKASAGVAFRAPVLRSSTAAEGCAALRAAGVRVLGLDARPGGSALFRDPLPERAALVLGNETDGLSPDVRAELDGTVAIPMRGGVESLNVASAAAVAAYELMRLRRP